jgi:uncharacterized membrane protein YhaH (DUF805 family)
MAQTSFRDLIRSPDGTIGKPDFRRGALIVLALSVVLGALLFGIFELNHGMAWMTVAVAPFFGVIFFFLAASLIYFWYCLFAKRLRSTGRGPGLLYGWLALLLVAAASRLVAYQNETLKLATEGWLTWAAYVADICAIAAFLVFAALLAVSWFGEEKAH